MDINQLKQDKIINECERHLQRLNYAKNQLKELFPLTEERYKNLSDDNTQAIDQLIYRFSKLQDAVGQKLIKIVFARYEENIDKYTMIDILNRLEKADILTTRQWQELRDIKNELSHHYDDDPMQSTIILNKVFEKEDVLMLIYQNIKDILTA